MSGSSALSTDAFTDSERMDVRRFCGYPAYGPGTSGFQSWRFFQAYGLLEFRLTNMAPAEFQQVRLYLSQLYPLETAIVGASANLDTSSASVWVHNPREVAERTALFEGWCARLCAFMGIPVGPSRMTSTAIVI